AAGRPARARARRAGPPVRPDGGVRPRGPAAQDPVPQPRRGAHRHRSPDPPASVRLRAAGSRTGGGDRRRLASLRATPLRAPAPRACAVAGRGRSARGPARLSRPAGRTGCVLAEGAPSASPRARAQAGPFALAFFHSLMDGSLRLRVPSSLATAVAEYRAV